MQTQTPVAGPGGKNETLKNESRETSLSEEQIGLLHMLLKSEEAREFLRKAAASGLAGSPQEKRERREEDRRSKFKSHKAGGEKSNPKRQAEQTKDHSQGATQSAGTHVKSQHSSGRKEGDEKVTAKLHKREKEEPQKLREHGKSVIASGLSKKGSKVLDDETLMAWEEEDELLESLFEPKEYSSAEISKAESILRKLVKLRLNPLECLYVNIPGVKLNSVILSFAKRYPGLYDSEDSLKERIRRMIDNLRYQASLKGSSQRKPKGSTEKAEEKKQDGNSKSAKSKLVSGRNRIGKGKAARTAEDQEDVKDTMIAAEESDASEDSEPPRKKGKKVIEGAKNRKGDHLVDDSKAADSAGKEKRLSKIEQKKQEIFSSPEAFARDFAAFMRSRVPASGYAERKEDDATGKQEVLQDVTNKLSMGNVAAKGLPGMEAQYMSTASGGLHGNEKNETQGVDHKQAAASADKSIREDHEPINPLSREEKQSHISPPSREGAAPEPHSTQGAADEPTARPGDPLGATLDADPPTSNKKLKPDNGLGTSPPPLPPPPPPPVEKIRQKRQKAGTTTRFEDSDYQPPGAAGTRSSKKPPESEPAASEEIRKGDTLKVYIGDEIIGKAHAIYTSAGENLNGHAIGPKRVGIIFTKIDEGSRATRIPAKCATLISEKLTTAGELPLDRVVDWPRKYVEASKARKKKA